MGRFLDRQFPEHRSRIAELRLCNREFDEICCQYEEIASLLEDRSSKPGQWQPFDDAMADLKREIAERLGMGQCE